MSTLPKTEISPRRILDVTRGLLIQQGLTQLSIRMIARAVGCSVGSIYFHFKNKDELIHALIEEGFDKLVALQDATEAAITDPRSRLSALCRNYYNFALSNPEYYEIMFTLKPERMARYPAEKYRKARRSVEVVSRAVEAYSRQQQTNVPHPYLAAHLIWCFMHGIVTLMQARRIDRSILPEAIIETSIQQILNANLTPPPAPAGG